MELKDAIYEILEGNGLLFTGAGASLNATNVKDESLGTLWDLTELLYAKCGLESDGNISNATDEFLEEFGEEELIRLLKDKYTIKEITQEHRTLLSVKWKRIYTTNYDNVIETALVSEHNTAYTSVDIQDRPSFQKDKSKLVVHLNGYINDLNRETLNNSFKLTESSYLTQDFIDSQWISLFRQDLKVSGANIFVGFSLTSDLDLKRIIFNTPDSKEKTFFIVGENEKETTLRSLRRYGTPLSIGLKGFAMEIQKAKQDYIPRPISFRTYRSFKKPQINELPPKVTNTDFFSLLQDGDINERILQFSIFSPDEFPYYVYREKLDKVINVIKNGDENILITSDIGNGKTMFIKGLSYLLHKNGYSVFQYDRFTTFEDEEIQRICESESKAVVIIESYTHHYDVIEKIESSRCDVKLILTERSMINDVTYSKLESILSSHIQFFDLNQLSDKEVDCFIKMFNTYGYWGDKTTFNDDQKFRFITDFDTNSCKRSLRLLLIKQLESSDILGRFQLLISSLKRKSKYYDALSLMLVSNVFNFTLQLDDLFYALDEQILGDYSFRQNPAIKEFINFDESRIKVKSAILSETVLRNLIDSESLVDTLIKVCLKLDKRRNDKNSKIILKELISFSNLERILKKDKEDYRFNILRFFEEIRNMDFCKKNPHYWLQSAISKLAERQYKQADQHFKTAYSFANKLEWFDTYQIDNHYARFLIENEIYFGSEDTCMTQFLKAHKILNNPNDRHKTRHYPFRVALNYFPFYDKYYRTLPKKDKTIFLRSCQEILERINVYMRNVENYRVKKQVEKAKELLITILTDEKSLTSIKV
nr:SIR2 family protein [uncultured Draconibacterium sp.]